MRTFLIPLTAAIVLAAVPAGASAFKYTHRVEISGEITDNWTTSDPASCGSNGTGSLTVSFTTKASTRIRPFISEFGGRPRSRKYGVWTLGVPGGAGVTHMGWRKSNATLTTVDNTTQGPNTDDPTQPCNPPDKSGCGTTTLKRTLTRASGWDKRYLYAALSFGGSSFDHVTSCRVGALESWVFPHTVAGGVNQFSDLLLKMPSARALRRKKVNVITATDHTLSSSKRSENGTESLTDDVTRKFTVTLTKL